MPGSGARRERFEQGDDPRPCWPAPRPPLRCAGTLARAAATTAGPASSGHAGRPARRRRGMKEPSHIGRRAKDGPSVLGRCLAVLFLEGPDEVTAVGELPVGGEFRDGRPGGAVSSSRGVRASAVVHRRPIHLASVAPTPARGADVLSRCRCGSSARRTDLPRLQRQGWARAAAVADQRSEQRGGRAQQRGARAQRRFEGRVAGMPKDEPPGGRAISLRSPGAAKVQVLRCTRCIITRSSLLSMCTGRHRTRANSSSRAACGRRPSTLRAVTVTGPLLPCRRPQQRYTSSPTVTVSSPGADRRATLRPRSFVTRSGESA
jgi:hypothetical protein